MVHREDPSAQPYPYAGLRSLRTRRDRPFRRIAGASGKMQTMTERETPPVDGLVIGILGGTGDQGRGLARRFALAGHQVIIGSRSAERAPAAAREIGHGVRGQANADAARGASGVIAAVPREGHGDLLSGLAAELAGQIGGGCAEPPALAPRRALALAGAQRG